MSETTHFYHGFWASVNVFVLGQIIFWSMLFLVSVLGQLT